MAPGVNPEKSSIDHNRQSWLRNRKFLLISSSSVLYDCLYIPPRLSAKLSSTVLHSSLAVRSSRFIRLILCRHYRLDKTVMLKEITLILDPHRVCASGASNTPHATDPINCQSQLGTLNVLQQYACSYTRFNTINPCLYHLAMCSVAGEPMID